ncbi:DUF4373 domain-containing protein [Bacteroidota bacterium]
MARPIKNNAEYFSHDCDASMDEKIMAIENEFGFKGYALYFKMLEIIAHSNYFEIEWTNRTKILYTGRLKVSVEELTDFIHFCIEIKAFEYKDDVLFSPGLKRRMQPLLEKRERMRIRSQKMAAERRRKLHENQEDLFE